MAGLVSLSMIHSEQRSLCGPQPLVVLPKGGSVGNGAEGCTDRGCMEVGSDDSSCKEERKVDGSWRLHWKVASHQGRRGRSQRRSAPVWGVDRGV